MSANFDQHQWFAGPRKLTAAVAKNNATGVPGYQLAPATEADIPGILQLQELNLKSRGGSLSIRFSCKWFQRAVLEMPVIVARCAGQVVGYVVSTPLTAQAHDPIIQAMLRAYPGSVGAYNYGPICVAGGHRGRGLAVSMFEQLRAQLPGREGLTFIRRDNASSIAFHNKMGLRQVAEFTLGDAGYVVVAYAG